MSAHKTKLPSGNVVWVAKFRYTDYTGSVKQKKKQGFKTKKEALEFEKSFLDKASANSDMLFSSLISHYFEHIESRLKPTTVENKKHLIEKKIQPFFDNMKLSDIESHHVEKWQNKLINEGYKPTYLKSIHNQLSAIFNYAIRFYKLRTNPARIVGSMGKKNADSFDFYTQDEFDTFIKAFDNDATLEIIFTIMFYTGIRLGELLALKPIDFDFNKNTMIIDENLQRVNGETIIQQPKTNSSIRSITLPEGLSLKIHEYINGIKYIKKNDLIFNVSKSHLGLSMTRGAKKAGLKRIKVHSLRHSHASHLIELKFPPMVISERLGHTNTKQLFEIYGHLYPNKDLEVANKLNDFF